MADLIHLKCTPGTFKPCISHPVRWLDFIEDYPLARDFWPPESPLTQDKWIEAQNLGYHYAAIIENPQIIALAAAWFYSEDAWELAAVLTRLEYRRRGYSKSVCSFITNYILNSGRIATCTTGRNNEAMRWTAISIGYYVVPSQ